MFSTLCDIVNNIINFFASFSNLIGLDMLFIIALGAEAVLVIFFLIKSSFSYEASLNRALDKINYWLFERKTVTEENIKDLNMLFKLKAPQRLCYYWQQYILFREGAPSSYLSTDNLIEKPLKTSSYNSNIKNLTIFTTVWAMIVGMFVLIVSCFDSYLTGKATIMALLVPILVTIIGVIFIVYLRARKNSVLNSLYQNVALFGRFMDNACIDLPSYIDYQILFTPHEIEKGQPVLREFLDYKARKEKEEFNKAKEQQINFESYDFASTGVDGSIVLDRAMKESELFLKKKEKILVKVSQIEAELDSRRKNFDNVQKDYQTKIQASKENVNRLRQMQEETTNRIESNYYRKQQTQEVAKQEQFEQEFEQLRAKYLLEKNEGENEIKKLNKEMAEHKNNVEHAMTGEYQTFFDNFCHSAELVVAKVFSDKINSLKAESDKNKQYISELEMKLKSVPQGAYDASADDKKNKKHKNEPLNNEIPVEGKFDEKGNYVYPNGTYYDTEGFFHDEKGNVYTQEGKLISQTTKKEEPKTEKKVVDLDSFDSFEFMTDVSQKEDIYSVAENIVNKVDKAGEYIVNESKKDNKINDNEPAKDDGFESYSLEKSLKPETRSVKIVEIDQDDEDSVKKKAGRPRKILQEEEIKPAGQRGRPKKITTGVSTEKKPVGRPKKIVKEGIESEEEKRGRGRPKKQIDTISEINKRLSTEEAKLSAMREKLNNEFESAMNGMSANSVDRKQARREQLLKEIDSLQKEAQAVINNREPESNITEINAKLEKLLAEIKNLNS